VLQRFLGRKSVSTSDFQFRYFGSWIWAFLMVITAAHLNHVPEIFTPINLPVWGYRAPPEFLRPKRLNIGIVAIEPGADDSGKSHCALELLSGDSAFAAQFLLRTMSKVLMVDVSKSVKSASWARTF
jgi:hypothetical protein